MSFQTAYASTQVLMSFGRGARLTEGLGASDLPITLGRGWAHD